MATNKDFAAINSLNKKIDVLYDNRFPPVLLQFSTVFKQLNSMNGLWKEIKRVSEIQYPIKVENNSFDTEYQQSDDYLKSLNTDNIKSIKSNIHIFEAFDIIADLK